MRTPLTRILAKIFVNGFYRVHAGMFLVIFLVMFGVVPASKLLMYHKTLMLAFLNGPDMMALVFSGWLIYTLKSWHYVFGKLKQGHQQFLFYSSNSFSKYAQFKSWFCIQLIILMPLMVYGGLTMALGIARHNFLSVFLIAFVLVSLAAVSALLYLWLVNKLTGGADQSFLLKLSNRWQKPFFSLFIFHIFDKMKLAYLVTKLSSWLIITGTFYFFADVRQDMRVAAIAVLAIITAHTRLVFEEHRFAETYLTFARNFGYSRVKLFLNFIVVYALLLLPEAVWLLSRFPVITAFELLLAGLSIILLFHCLLYQLGLNMDKYLQWILGLFVVLFWGIMFKVIWMLILLNMTVAFVIFYNNYYNTRPITKAAGS